MKSSASNASLSSAVQVDDWDAEGFVIPSLQIDQMDETTPEQLKSNNHHRKKDETRSGLQKSSHQKVTEAKEEIYLGPHGTPPSLLNQSKPSCSGSKWKEGAKASHAHTKKKVTRYYKK
ncbi:uncharacterized protein [Aristolochia californica]|uniref:uncharacterized protein n=1 Tax=Aristolochia californica TaxID=171875 RepID=UPI0035D530A0